MKFHKLLVFMMVFSLAVFANSSVYSQDDDDDDDMSEPEEMDEDMWQAQMDEYTAKKADLTSQLATLTTEIEQLKFGLTTRTDAAENAVNSVWAAVGSKSQYEEYKSKFADAENGAKATLTAIMGRMAAYSGQLVEWDKALNSTINLQPNAYTWDTLPKTLPDKDGWYDIPMPGKTVAV